MIIYIFWKEYLTYFMDEWQATKTTQKLKMATMFKSIMDKKKNMIFVLFYCSQRKC